MSGGRYSIKMKWVVLGWKILICREWFLNKATARESEKDARSFYCEKALGVKVNAFG